MPQGFPPILVRPRIDADLPASVAVLRRVHESDGYPRRWHEPADAWLTPEATIAAWVADDGAVLGHVVLEEASDGLEVGRLFVDPGARRRGVAGLLLGTVETESRRLGLPLALVVDVHGLAAIRFYEQRGWARTGTREAPWREPDGSPAHCHTYLAPS